MILEILLMPFWLFIDLLLRLVPTIPILSINVSSLSGILGVIGYGIWVIGGPVFIMVLTSISFWTTFHLSTAVITWVTDKLPFIG